MNRNTIKGKEYYGIEADIALFADLYLRKKNGIDIDEIVNSTIKRLVA